MMRRYWLSWYQPTDDYRPMTDPPHPQVLGWWKSGENECGQASICALVEAESEERAKVYVGISWPEAPDAVWRFCEEKPSNYTPGDRFVLKPWVQERMARDANQ